LYNNAINCRGARKLRVLNINYVHKNNNVTSAGIKGFLENSTSIAQLSISHLEDVEGCAKAIMDHPTLKVIGSHSRLQYTLKALIAEAEKREKEGKGII